LPASRRPFLLAAVATIFVAAARFFPLAPLLDAATLAPAEGFRLVIPASHLLLTPWSTLGDLTACSSLPQVIMLVLFLWALVGPVAWAVAGYGRDERRSPKAALRALGAWGLFLAAALAWGVLAPRAPARIEAADPELMAVDFHSHTSLSHDGRSWFTPAENLAWHGRAGYGAAFITDHNRGDGYDRARDAWRGAADGAAPLKGEELSLHGAHVLLYGAPRVADPNEYAGLAGLEQFLRDSRKHLGGLAVPSLPEYWEHHRSRVAKLADWGAAGFEIVAASPKGLAVPPEFRAAVVSMCRQRGLFVTGGTDNHGYGSTSCVASFVRAPGWRGMDAAARESAVMNALTRGGFFAVRVVARSRALTRPMERGLASAVEPPRALWDAARSWTGAQAFAAVVWAWLLAAACWAAAERNKVH
jgi:hypothetical protein